MRLHRLEVTGVGPFRDRQIIDFEPMMDAGLFLIDGPTGSGKTTIIDAITFALFGTTSGFASDSDRLRSDYCSLDDPTEVVLEFSVRGRRHRLARSPEYVRATKRKTESGVTTQAARQNLIEYAADGSERVTLTAAADIGVHIQELLGMDSHQFRQLVVLPQGEFAHLLRMLPRERLDALRHLLGSDFFTRVQQELVLRADAARSDLRAARTHVDASVRAVATRTAETDLPFTEACTTLTSAESPASVRLAALEEIMAGMQRAASEAATHDEQSQQAFNRARAERDAADQAAAAVRAAADARVNLERALSKLPTPVTDESVLESERRAISERIGALRPLAEWESHAQEREHERDRLESESEALKLRVEELVELRDTLPSELHSLAQQLGAAEAAVREQPHVQQRLETATERAQERALIASLTSNTQMLEEVVTRCDGEHRAADDSLQAAEKVLDEIYQARVSGYAAQLAGELIEGEPCPVCGGVEHPRPAAAQMQYPSDQDVQAAQQALSEARTSVEHARAAHQQAEGELRAHLAKLGALRDRWDQGPALDPHVEVEELRANLADLEQAARNVVTLQAHMSALNERASHIDRELRSAELASVKAVAQLQGFDERVRERLAEIQAFTDTTATETLTQSENRLLLIDQVMEAWRRVKVTADALDDVHGDPEVIEQRAISTQEEFARATVAAEQSRARTITLANAYQALVDLAAEVRDALNTEATIAEQAHDAVHLADIAAAKSPANRLKLTLATYAVQLRFAHVLDYASVHLERMSAGQYSFALDAAVHGRGLSGLGISVRDAWTGQDRDPKTLSGGETFYASLALALGLADVVQAETGGAELETLFVDEGFGSLDSDTLQLVLDQLDQLRSGGRVVGVISHVMEMKERIADRIQVVSQPDHTSRVEQVPEATHRIASAVPD